MEVFVISEIFTSMEPVAFIYLLETKNIVCNAKVKFKVGLDATKAV